MTTSKFDCETMTTSKDDPRNELVSLDPANLLRAGLSPSASRSNPSSGFVPPEAEVIESLLEPKGYSSFELLSHGGMGAVYKAIEKKFDRPVAVKILPAILAQDPTFAERFIQEARALGKLRHPNIVGVHDFGESQPYFYLVMEYVEGGNLRDQLDRGPLEPTRIREVALQVCNALAAAHVKGIIHRDLKPENILVDIEGAVLLADFGLAKVVKENSNSPSLTGTRQALGTPNYIAPEQLEPGSDVDHRVDLYALGVLIYELLTGKLPIGRFEPPSKRGAGVSPEWDPIIMRLLDADPDKRFSTAASARKAIDATAKKEHGRLVEATNEETSATTHNRRDLLGEPVKRALAFVVFAGIGIALLSLLSWGTLQGKETYVPSEWAKKNGYDQFFAPSERTVELLVNGWSGWWELGLRLPNKLVPIIALVLGGLAAARRWGAFAVPWYVYVGASGYAVLFCLISAVILGVYGLTLDIGVFLVAAGHSAIIFVAISRLRPKEAEAQ